VTGVVGRGASLIVISSTRCRRHDLYLPSQGHC
jgi:hypothetical protein